MKTTKVDVRHEIIREVRTEIVCDDFNLNLPVDMMDADTLRLVLLFPNATGRPVSRTIVVPMHFVKSSS